MRDACGMRMVVTTSLFVVALGLSTESKFGRSVENGVHCMSLAQSTASSHVCIVDRAARAARDTLEPVVCGSGPRQHAVIVLNAGAGA